MEDKFIRNLVKNPKDLRVSSLPVSSNTNWFSHEDSLQVIILLYRSEFLDNV